MNLDNFRVSYRIKSGESGTEDFYTYTDCRNFILENIHGWDFVEIQSIRNVMLDDFLMLNIDKF